MTSLWERPALELLERAASGAPTPGGGSTAALTGAFGAALLGMAVHITLKKEEGEAEDLTRPLQTLTEVRARLQALADEDVRAFGAYVHATRLPDGTEEENREREKALAEAGQASLRVPLELAHTLMDTLTLAPSLAARVHREVSSDVGAGAAILEGALHASLLTVEINLPHVPEGERLAVRAERDRLAGEGRRLAAGTLRLTRERLARGD